jgi:hypothetical protein
MAALISGSDWFFGCGSALKRIDVSLKSIKTSFSGRTAILYWVTSLILVEVQVFLVSMLSLIRQ